MKGRALRSCLLLLTGVFVIGLAALVFRYRQHLRDDLYIVWGRIEEKARALSSPPVLRRDYDAVVDHHTEQALEVESYLAGWRQRQGSSAADLLQFDFSSEDEFRRSSEKLRASLRASLGYPPPDMLQPDSPPSLVQIHDDNLATYYQLRVPILPGVHAGGLFIEPKGTSGKIPLVISAHGRGGQPSEPADGKLTLIGGSNRDLVLGALKKGYAVWAPVFVFYAAGRPVDIRERLDSRAREAGTTLPAIEIAKTIGGLDALLRRENIDASRVAMVGFSYGGFYTLYTAALEERIRVAVVSAYFNDRAAVLDASAPFGFFDWRFRGSASLFSDPAIAALVCPRPLQIQAGTHDQLFPIEGVRKAVPAVRALYERLNVGDRFSYVESIARHDFNAEAAWEFVERSFASGNPAPVPAE